MVVRDRGWSAWDGPVTPASRRFLVLTRFALKNVFESRLFLAFYILCLVPSAVALLAIYFSHNTQFLEQFGGVDSWFAKAPDWIFLHLFGWQTLPAFLVAVIATPPLIAADIGNNALQIILARPLRRREYILGKSAVLFLLLSPITWIPGLMTFTLQALLAGGHWTGENIRIAIAFFIGHLVWILVVTMLCLAVSAWVRLASFARGALVAVFMISSGAGRLINGVTRSSIGDLLNLGRAMDSIVMRFFGATPPSTLPAAANWLTLIVVVLGSLWVLNLRLRAIREIR
jgi:ABC-type transport system involved in multi-copper enzyme maturation permease subunit